MMFKIFLGGGSIGGLECRSAGTGASFWETSVCAISAVSSLFSVWRLRSRGQVRGAGSDRVSQRMECVQLAAAFNTPTVSVAPFALVKHKVLDSGGKLRALHTPARGSQAKPIPPNTATNISATSPALLALLGLLCAVGCQTAPPLPPVNLKEPGWTVREGQAMWRAKRDAPEIAGEILLATHPDGRAFLQFTKTPFPFVIARAEPDSWQIEMPTRNKRYSGRGKPPGRVLWLQFLLVLSGSAPPQGWSWRAPKDGRWRFENLSTGELLQGYFTPPPSASG